MAADDSKEPISSARDVLLELLQIDENQLYLRLADQVSAGVGGMDDDFRRRLGAAWFREQLSSLKHTVCGDAKLRELRSQRTDELTLASTVADLISTEVHGPAVFTLAVLIVKYGLDRLCPSTLET